MTNKNILLVEPGYRNKYPPLGLMKIAQYHGPSGKKDNVRFVKGEDPSAYETAWDRVYITTLFSFEWERTARSIDYALDLVGGQAHRVFVGGIAASLMHENFIDEPKWRGVRFIKGLLGEAPAVSLGLDPFDEELYADDVNGKPIEDLVPDYSILDHIEYQYPVNDAYFTYASRGCVRKCAFCGVPKLEGGQRDTNSLTEVVEGVSKLYGEKRDLILMDNNVVASANFKDIIAEIIDLGFERGAKLKRGRYELQRRVDFNQGVDARILCKDPMYLQQLSRIALKPLRIAFDHLGVKKPYEQAIRYSAEAGITELSNYMLYNFHDDPADLFERMRLNVTLNEELGIRIFSFPMRYQPVTRPDRGHIGKRWNSYYLRSMQVILQATHGVVSGAPDFFRTAYGDTFEEFENILLRPHHYIFNRFWYEQYDGRAEFDSFQNAIAALSSDERTELIEYLCSRDKNDYVHDLNTLAVGKLRDAARYFVPMSKSDEAKIWSAQKLRRVEDINSYLVPEDERVEDAGLTDEDVQPGSKVKAQIKNITQVYA
ncbi:radical SAM protein [Algicella marina]|uniref:Radical SAM protein n=1 Tax=Algicella marina TaxID=2683284 RepID=A0A6P1SXD8_9RHOB|nr:radical SAM protein [Algicella marina]QHQ34427.1 radical SAM protein [Algicella marina]